VTYSLSSSFSCANMSALRCVSLLLLRDLKQGGASVKHSCRKSSGSGHKNCGSTMQHGSKMTPQGGVYQPFPTLFPGFVRFCHKIMRWACHVASCYSTYSSLIFVTSAKIAESSCASEHYRQDTWAGRKSPRPSLIAYEPRAYSA
jgi:hypothetical protein